MTLWTVNLLFRRHSFSSSAACLSFDVSVCPTELPWIQQRGVWVVGGIRNFWHMSHISTLSLSFLVASSSLFLFTPLQRFSVVEKKEKETTACMACRGLNRSETLLSNSHQPCVNPQGDRENSKHRSPAKTKKRTTVRPLSAACVLCKGPTGCQSRRRMPG